MIFRSNIGIFLNICFYYASATHSDVQHRSKRQLLFPNSTLLQFNAGIGTPSVEKHINVNYAFQANFQLPWNRTQIPTDILNVYPGYDGDSRGKRESGDYESDAKLFHFYKYVEDVLNGFGHNGNSCVKQALCQLGAQPLHSDDEEDLLHELASFVLNPTNDIDHHVTEKHEAFPYIQAYRHGQAAANCGLLYDKCTFSLVDMFTQLHHVV